MLSLMTLATDRWVAPTPSCRGTSGAAKLQTPRGQQVVCVPLRAAVGLAALAIALAIVAEAQAIHPYRRAAWLYDSGYGGPLYPGPSSANPVGFGFGGYSYGEYPHYGYWGYLPGPYAGFSGYGPPSGPGLGYAGYRELAAPGGACPDVGCEPACQVAPAPCAPACGMTPHAYRRYLRRMYRAMARCGLWCAPVPAPCSYGVMLGAEAIVDGEISGEFDAGSEAISEIDAESVVPPAEEHPTPLLERSF